VRRSRCTGGSGTVVSASEASKGPIINVSGVLIVSVSYVLAGERGRELGVI
jgi:hypothetical protein